MDRLRNLQPRVVVYIKDVEILTGRKPGAARKLLLKIRRYYKKERGQYITYQEFSLFTGICEEMVYAHLNS
jgi:hypothetical protein